MTGLSPERRPRAVSTISLTVDEKVVLNIGGHKFTTFKSTLQNVPNTKLAKITEADPAYDATSGEYFFDRNPTCFNYILDYYRTGRLHMSHCTCGPAMKAELEFWEIDDNCISSCCWRAYKSFEDEKSTLDELKDLFKANVISTDLDHCHEIRENNPLRKNASKKTNWFKKWSDIIWGFMDEPTSSKGAQLWAIVMFLLILVSIGAAAMETHPLGRVPRNNSTISLPNSNNTKLLMYYVSNSHPSISIIDGVCVTIFSLELAIRILVCPSKLKFFKSFYNIIDILCVLPFLITFIIGLVDEDFWLGSEFIFVIGYLSLSSVLRIFRLFKMARHYKSFRLMVLAVKSSIRELFLLILLITMGMLIFSTLIYFAEFNVENDNFTNIPIGFWWSIVTMTTVGYGDLYPDGVYGYLVGGACAVSGTLITGLPIPIIASNFNRYYNTARLITKIATRSDPKTKWINLDQRTLLDYNQKITRRNGLVAPISARYTSERLLANHTTHRRGSISVLDLKRYSNVVVPSVHIDTVDEQHSSDSLGDSYSKDSSISYSPKSGVSMLSSNNLLPNSTTTTTHR